VDLAENILPSQLKANYYLYLLSQGIKKYQLSFKDYYTNVLKKDHKGAIKWIEKSFSNQVEPHNITLPLVLREAVEKKELQYDIKLTYEGEVIQRIVKKNGQINNFGLSMIFRVYHNHHKLRSLIESVAKQKIHLWELILVVDERGPFEEIMEEQGEKTKYLTFNLDNYLDSKTKKIADQIKVITFDTYHGVYKSYCSALIQAEHDIVLLLNENPLCANSLSQLMKIYNSSSNPHIFVKTRDNLSFRSLHYFVSSGISERYDLNEQLMMQDLELNLRNHAKEFYLDISLQESSFSSEANINSNSSSSSNSSLLSNENSSYHSNNMVRYWNESENNSSRLITPNDYFDQVYVINLAKDQKKKERMVKVLSGLGISHKIFPAVYGKEHRTEYDEMCKSSNYSIGAFGYTLSMHGILRDALDAGHKKILVFDDDVIFHKDFHKKFHQLVTAIPTDWYLLQLGISGPWTHPFVNSDYKSFDFSKPYLNSYFNCDGSFATGYDSHIFQEIINLTSTFNYPFDTEIMKHYTIKNFNRCYTAMPHLVIADVSTSDISIKKTDPYQNYMDHQYKYKINLSSYDLDSLNHTKYKYFDINYKPLVTVIVTVYKKEEYIKEVINSILNQTYENIELILVNDLSPDGSLKIMRETIEEWEKEKDKQTQTQTQTQKKKREIKLITNDLNKGCYASRNVGLALAQGDFIAYHDADDHMVSTRIELQVTEMLENNLMICSSNMLRSHVENFTGMSENEILEKVNVARSHVNEANQYHECCRVVFGYPTLMYKRELFARTGNFNEFRKGMDMEFGERILYTLEGITFAEEEDSWEFFENETRPYYKKLSEILVISPEMNENNITSQTTFNEKFEQMKRNWRSGFANDKKN
jgi:glycosyltransferase involved in cell wall biosynthesis